MSRTAAVWYVQRQSEPVGPRRDGNRAQRRAWARENRTLPEQPPAVTALQLPDGPGDLPRPGPSGHHPVPAEERP